MRCYGDFDECKSEVLDELVSRLDARDAALLVELKRALTHALRAFEHHDPRSHGRTVTHACRSWLRCVAALRRHYHECRARVGAGIGSTPIAGGHRRGVTGGSMTMAPGRT
jgi:hypothetical protein